MNKKIFAKKIVEWYEINKRSLPWRETRDPYRIWLSEVILQQTRVAQGLPYYTSFVEKYPDIFSLAAAREESVLLLWQGLGYYTRARNLHRCAKVVAERFGGKFPSLFEELRKLPGIGDYTAAAIASVAFGERVAVADGNVYRVLARVFGMHDDIATGAGKAVFFNLAQSIIPAGRPDQFNQAIMEFGALHCTPKNPRCTECPLVKSCSAYANDWQAQLPVKGKGLKVRNRYLNYIVFRKGKTVAMHRRTGQDIWHGLFDFFLIESKKPEDAATILANDSLKSFRNEVKEVSPVYKHQLSHQKLYARFISVNLSKPSAGIPGSMRFYTARQMARLPKPVLVSRFLEQNPIL